MSIESEPTFVVIKDEKSPSQSLVGFVAGVEPKGGDSILRVHTLDGAKEYRVSTGRQVGDGVFTDRRGRYKFYVGGAIPGVLKESVDTSDRVNG